MSSQDVDSSINISWILNFATTRIEYKMYTCVINSSHTFSAYFNRKKTIKIHKQYKNINSLKKMKYTKVYSGMILKLQSSLEFQNYLKCHTFFYT